MGTGPNPNGLTLTLPRSFIGRDDENENTKHRRTKQTKKMKIQNKSKKKQNKQTLEET